MPLVGVPSVHLVTLRPKVAVELLTADYDPTGLTDATPTRGIGSSDDTQFSADRWSNGFKTWWPVYTPHPGHLKIAGVAGHPTHTQEHLQTIQKHQDHILSP